MLGRMRPATERARALRWAGLPRLAALDALAEPRFRPLWYAGLFLNSARWLDFLILAWVALELTGSPFLVGIAAFVRAAPMMVLGLFAGVMVDRLPRGRLLIGVQVLNLAVSLALAALFASEHPRFDLLLALELLV